MKKLIIEARMNEAAKKADNPNVPYTPAEISADALACAEAGAAIVHFHARKENGAESNDVDHYREAIAGIRAESDVVIHTTLALFRETDPDKRLAHIDSLVKDSNLRPDIAPLDMGSNNVDFWDPAEKTFTGNTFVYINRTEDLRTMAERLRGWGIKPQLSLWQIANARLAGAFAAAGLVDDPMFALCYVGGESFLAGHPATSAGLRAFVDNLPYGPDRRIEWSVMGFQTDLLRLVPEIVSLGGHVSLGLGDFAYAGYDLPSNADLVRRVADIARTMGREVATPAEARVMLGL